MTHRAARPPLAMREDLLTIPEKGSVENDPFAAGRLTHESLKAILEDRNAAMNIHGALARTVSGLVAHKSALRDGETPKFPQFDTEA